MPIESSKTQDIVTASSVMRPANSDSATGGGVFTVTCTGADGQVKWEDTFHNLVVNEGLQYMNQSFFAGVGYTAAWYLGLITGPGAGNTVTGLMTAQMDSVPMIVLCGQQVTWMLGKDAFQEADIFNITAPVVKHNFLVKQTNALPRIAKEAYHIATTGRPGRG